MIAFALPGGTPAAGRRRSAAALLPAALQAAGDCGVTRLADVTALDRIGLPVWQAIRPMSRALSVHQGKGATADDARLGALLEAVESDHAERFVADGPVATHAALDPADRAPCLADFAAGGAIPADVPRRWAVMPDLIGGGRLHVPEDIVSLDLTTALDTGLDRSSTGLACGADHDDAAASALREVIERDAFAEWHAAGLWAAMDSVIAPSTVPWRWFAALDDRLADLGIVLRCYWLASVTGTPVTAVELNDLNRRERGLRAIHGTGCHHDPEIALWRAVTEAIQGRATLIAGAREDIGQHDHAPVAAGQVSLAFALPPPSGGIAWPQDAGHAGDLDSLAGRLADAGYRQAGVLTLGNPAGLHVVKAFVPGLGSLERRRRAAA